MEAGRCISGAMLHAGIDAMTAGNGIVAAFPEFDVVLAEMDTLFAGWFVHGNHLGM